MMEGLHKICTKMKKKVFFILMAVVTLLIGCHNKGGEDMAEQKDFETMKVSKQDILVHLRRLKSIWIQSVTDKG